MATLESLVHQLLSQERGRWDANKITSGERTHDHMGSFTSSFVRYPVMVYTSTLGGSWNQGIRFFCSFPMTFVSSVRRGTSITSVAEYSKWMSSSMSSVVFSSPWFSFSLTSSSLLLSQWDWALQLGSSLFALVRQSRATTKLFILDDAGGVNIQHNPAMVAVSHTFSITYLFLPCITR